MTPLRRQNIFHMVWREIYPVGLHYLISQLLGSAVLLWLMGHSGNARDSYYSCILALTGIAGVLVMPPALHFYRKDRVGRVIGGLTSIEEQRITIPEMLLLLAAGAGLAQYANVLIAILQNWIQSTTYRDTMSRIISGKSLFMMIFWMGIIAPVAEEMIFRWLVYLRLRDHFSVLASTLISAVFFGIYHGNIPQAIYTFILGVAFAWFLEMGGNKWISVFLHMGANIWILIFGEYAGILVKKNGAGILLMIYGILAVAMIAGYQYFARRGEKRGYRAV